jgi:hypothetical protein
VIFRSTQPVIDTANGLAEIETLLLAANQVEAAQDVRDLLHAVQSSVAAESAKCAYTPRPPIIALLTAGG